MLPGLASARATALHSVALLAATSACSSTFERELEGQVRAWSALEAPRGLDVHRGPPVAPGKSGPGRFVDALKREFDGARALATAAAMDRFTRAPASPGFDASLDHIAAELAAAGFGSRPGLVLRWLVSEEPVHAWTPLRGRLAIAGEAGEQVLHEFTDESDVDRLLLPRGARSCDVAGEIAFALDELDAGEILVVEQPLSSIVAEARKAGAAALVSAHLYDFNRASDESRDAISYAELGDDELLPCAQISPAALDRIHEAREREPTCRLVFTCDARVELRVLRTLVAEIEGQADAGRAAVLAAHAQEPGACDNASGCAGLAEGVAALARAIESGKRARPAHTVSIVWGDEFGMSRAWLAQSGRAPIAALSCDMLGESRERTGAIALLERGPDPGAVHPLAPDAHTPWWDGQEAAEMPPPNGLAVVVRCALRDAGEDVSDWVSGEHPFEGGSDHALFVEQGIPAALLWHFTDFTYHTSLDRMDRIDARELERCSVAAIAAALALADARPTDLERYLESLRYETRLRVGAAEDAGLDELAREWEGWCEGARQWLRVLCLGPEAAPPESR